MKNIRIAIAFIVILSAFAFTKSDVLSTSLRITVINELGNVEEGASVQLFPTEEDYRNETNAVSEVLKTDDKGRVKFNDLEPKVYFVNAVKGERNNIGAGVQTDVLIEGKMNKVNIVIE